MNDEKKWALDKALSDLSRSAREFSYAIEGAERGLRDADFKRASLDAPDAAWKKEMDSARHYLANLRRAWAVTECGVDESGWLPVGDWHGRHDSVVPGERRDGTHDWYPHSGTSGDCGGADRARDQPARLGSSIGT